MNNTERLLLLLEWHKAVGDAYCSCGGHFDYGDSLFQHVFGSNSYIKKRVRELDETVLPR